MDISLPRSTPATIDDVYPVDLEALFASGSTKRKKSPPDHLHTKAHCMDDDHLAILASAGFPVRNHCAIYKGDKAKLGLNPSEVRRIDCIGVYAVKHMQSPIGFQLMIYPSKDHSHTKKSLSYLPRLLDRFGESNQMPSATSARILFAYKIEASRGGKSHIHLHCIADGHGMHQINCLKSLLGERFDYEVKLCMRAPEYDGNRYSVYNQVTGESIKDGESFRRHAWHFLKNDFEDWRERASYIAKNLTRKPLGKFQAFHCSRVKL